MRSYPLLLTALLVAPGTVTSTRAELRLDKVHVADSKKNLSYIRDGLITGGDQAIDGAVVKDIRRASNPGFERIVIDLESTQKGEAAAIDRPPYYQVAVTPDEKRLVFTLWGKPRLAFDPKKVVDAFRKSQAVQRVVLMPKVEGDTWTFVFELNGERPVEVFELSHPVRVIMDIKVPAAPPKPSKKAPKKAHKKAQKKHAEKPVKHPTEVPSAEIPAIDPEEAAPAHEGEAGE